MFFDRNCPRCIYIFQLEAKARRHTRPCQTPTLNFCQKLHIAVDCQSGNVSSARMQWKTIKLFIPFYIYRLPFIYHMHLFIFLCCFLFAFLCFVCHCLFVIARAFCSVHPYKLTQRTMEMFSYLLPLLFERNLLSNLLNMNYGIDYRVLGMAARRHIGTRVAAWCWPAWRRDRCSPGYWARRTPSSSTVRISRCSKQRTERERERS